jgi:hypothetical protein
MRLLSNLRAKTIYTGLCLLFAFVSGLQTSEAHQGQTEIRSPTTGFHSAADRARPLLNAESAFQPSVFSEIMSREQNRAQGGDGRQKELFPSCDFANPERAHQLLGDYEIDVTFYNRDYEAVDEPTTAGRCGAVVRIKAEDGRVYTRLRTLYRTPKRQQLWGEQLTTDTRHIVFSITKHCRVPC